MTLEEEGLLRSYAERLEAAYLPGMHEIPPDQNLKRHQLLEKAKECIPHASQTDPMALWMHAEVALGLDDLVLANRYASEALGIVESGEYTGEGVEQDILHQDILACLGSVRQAQEDHKEAGELFVRAIEALTPRECLYRSQMQPWRSLTPGSIPKQFPFWRELYEPHHTSRTTGSFTSC